MDSLQFHNIFYKILRDIIDNVTKMCVKQGILNQFSIILQATTAQKIVQNLPYKDTYTSRWKNSSENMLSSSL